MIFRKILIIHDSESTRALLHDYICSEMHDVIIREAESKAEAERLISEQEFDIILSNIVIEKKNKDTRVVLLLPRNSNQEISELPAFKDIELQFLPITAKKLQEKINEGYDPRSLRRQTRFSIPGIQAIFHLQDRNLEAKVINFSESGFLCEINITGNYHDLLKQIPISLKFPKEFNNIVLEQIECNYLNIRNISRDLGKNCFRLQIVWVFCGVNEKNRAALQAIAELLRNNRKMAQFQWREKPFELSRVTTKKNFLFASFLLFFVALFLLFFYYPFNNEEAELLWFDRQVLHFDQTENEWKETKTGIKYPAETRFRITTKKPVPFPYKSSKQAAVIRYNKRELVQLAGKGEMQRKVRDSARIEYSLNGIVHLILNKKDHKGKLRLLINGIQFETEKSHLYYNDTGKNRTLSIISGQIILPPQLSGLVLVSDRVRQEDGNITLTGNEVLYFEQGAVRIKTERKNQQYAETFSPGFDSDGPFHHIAYAETENGKYQLKRSGKSFQVSVPRIPIMEGDEIVNESKKTVLLLFKTQDLTRIYENSQLLVERFQDKAESRLPTLIIGVQAADLKKVENRYKFKGKIRVRVNPKRKKFRRVRFQTASAVISVKGTEFETTTTKGHTEVLGITGVVSLSDSKEQKSVEITRGMMSSVSKNELPGTPVKIPEERMARLLSDSFEKKERPQLLPMTQVGLNDIVLAKDTRLTLYWNKSLKEAKAIINGKEYPMPLSQDGFDSFLAKTGFPDLKPALYTAKLTVLDKDDISETFNAKIHILTDFDPDLFCGKADLNLAQKRKEVIMEFQRQANIRVDGIVGPETRGKIREVLSCRTNGTQKTE